MTQEAALSILKTGAHVFLTGEPGSGKTHTLNGYTRYLAEHGIYPAVTASTGIAATHIGGTTIHSWSGIGIKETLTPYDLDRLGSNERLVKRLNRASVLVIDEISMLDAYTFNMVDLVLRTVRRNETPFGGMQVIVVGDFFQLPPVARRGEVKPFAFESPVWEALRLITCYLTEQHRHESDDLHLLLTSLRRGCVEVRERNMLRARHTAKLDLPIEATKLFTHNVDVDHLNEERLAKIKASEREFIMTSRGSKPLVEQLKRSCTAPEKLLLKEGAAVMCTKNNFDAGFVNGTLGRVSSFEKWSGYPIIETLLGDTITIEPMTWGIEEEGKVLAEISQIPLRLAWAITVHKSQGMSLDAAEIDLSKAFEYGQGYVALSRLRTLAGLSLTGFNDRALNVHPEILRRDVQFLHENDEADATFACIAEEELHAMHERFIKASGGSLAKVSADKKHSIKERESTHLITLRFLKEQKTLKEIAIERGLKPTTILGHLEKLKAEGKLGKGDLVHITPSGNGSRELLESSKKAFGACGTEKLTPVFKYLKGRYSFDDLRLARLLLTENE